MGVRFPPELLFYFKFDYYLFFLLKQIQNGKTSYNGETRKLYCRTCAEVSSSTYRQGTTPKRERHWVENYYSLSQFPLQSQKNCTFVEGTREVPHISRSHETKWHKEEPQKDWLAASAKGISKQKWLSKRLTLNLYKKIYRFFYFLVRLII